MEAKVDASANGLERDDAVALTSLVKAWESCQERIRIHKGRPMPGSLKPTAAGKVPKLRVGDSLPTRSKFRSVSSTPSNGVPLADEEEQTPQSAQTPENGADTTQLNGT